MKKVFDRATIKIITLNQSDVLTDSFEHQSVDNPFSTPVLGMGKNSDFKNPFSEN